MRISSSRISVLNTAQCALCTLIAASFINDTMAQDVSRSAAQMGLEEQYAQSLINYFAPPETVEVEPVFNKTSLRFKSEVELAASLSKLNEAVEECILLRKNMESKIGFRPGSYSVHTQWVTKYQNCLLQRRTELNDLDEALRASYTATIEGGGENGATLLTAMIDRLRSAHSRSARRLDKELKLQRKFVDYYNTGVKQY